MTLRDAERVSETACRIPSRSCKSRSKPARYDSTAVFGSKVVAIAWCRCRKVMSPSRQAASRCSAFATSDSKPSVTPLQADNTTPKRDGAQLSRMVATRRKQSASATLDPPNLCTTQSAGEETTMMMRKSAEKPRQLYRPEACTRKFWRTNHTIRPKDAPCPRLGLSWNG